MSRLSSYVLLRDDPPLAGYGGFTATRVMGDQSRVAPLLRLDGCALASA